MTNTPAISAKNLYKVYLSKKNDEKVVLKSIDLDIPKGSFFGLLGPNGAGKSTFINILAGLVNKTSGDVSICGYDIVSQMKKARKSIGIVPQELVLDPFFPPYEALENTAGYYGVPKKERRTMEILEAMGLKDKAYAQSRKLSGGMKRRLLIAKALVHSPDVLVLDEPTAGVDVELRNQLWDYVKELNKQGTTIVLTTHYLEEAEELCDKIAVINHGQIIANKDKKDLMKTIDRKKIVIHPASAIENIPSEISQYNAKINSEGAIEIQYKASDISINQILKSFSDCGISIKDLSTVEVRLEEVFKHLTSV